MGGRPECPHAAPGGTVTVRRTVYPWHCDTMGHCATQHFMAFFDDATWGLLAALGYDATARDAASAWADVSHTIEYRAEVRPGHVISVRSAVLGIGTSSLRYRHELGFGAPWTAAAVLEGTCVHLDAATRRPSRVPERYREVAGQLFGSGTAGSAPRTALVP